AECCREHWIPPGHPVRLQSLLPGRSGATLEPRLYATARKKFRTISERSQPRLLRWRPAPDQFTPAFEPYYGPPDPRGAAEGCNLITLRITTAKASRPGKCCDTNPDKAGL